MIAASSTLEEHSKRRWRAILHTGLASGGAKAVAMVCSLAQVPIALRHLGPEAFGLWMTLTSTMALLSFADLGLGLGIQSKVAEAYGKDDILEARNIFLVGMFWLAVIALILFLLLASLCTWANWGSFFKVQDTALRAQTSQCMILVAGIFCLGMPLGLFPRLASGLQLGWLTGVWTSVGGILSLAFVTLAATLDLRFLAFLALALLPPVLVNVGLGIVLFRKLQWNAFKGSAIDWSTSRSLIGQGFLFVIPQINTLALSAVPQIIISSTLGVGAVTPYNLVQRLLNIIVQGLIMFIQPMWPAYAEARARGDWPWIRKAFKHSLVSTALVSFVFCFLFSVTGQKIILFWSQNAGNLPSRTLLCLMSLFTFLMLVGTAGSCLLGGCKRLKGMSLYATASSLLFLILAFPLARSFGVEGVVFGMIASYSLFTLTGSFVEIYCWLIKAHVEI